MAKGQDKKLLLKKKLMATKDMLVDKLTSRESSNLPLAVRKIYQSWLGNINEIITICEERNKF